MTVLVKALDGAALGWLWLTLLLIPVLALAGGLGFQVAGFALGLFALLAWSANRTGADYLRAAWPLWLLGLVLWAWVSSLWSPYESNLFGGNASVLFGMVAALLFVPFVFLRASDRAKTALEWGIITAGLVGTLLLLTDAASGYAVSLFGDPVRPGEDPRQRLSDAEMNLGRGQVSYALLLWPVAALLIARVKNGWILALAAFAALMLSAYYNALFVVIPALGLAGVMATLAWRRPRLGLILGFILAILSLALAPALGLLSSFIDADTMQELPLSWEHRLRMWAYSWDLIKQAPLLGHGFDSARVFDDLTFRAPDERDITVMSMHPHNIGLQIWLETGLIGVLLSIGFLLTLLKTTLETCGNSVRAFAACGLLVTVAISGAVTVGVWQHWWWALIVLAVSLICLVPSEPMRRALHKNHIT